MATIPLQSGIVNAVIFVVVDVLAVWAVNRGLLALQGYSLYRAACAGRSVTLKRSRIPIVTGELLDASTIPSYLIHIASVAVLVLAFVATLGVNGETQKLFNIPIERNYVTSLSSSPISMDDAYFHVVCRDSNVSHITFWPLALDSTDFSSDEFVTPNKSTILCLRDVQGVEPMLSVRNCYPDWITCVSVAERSYPTVRFSWSAPAYDVLYNPSHHPPPSQTQFRQVPWNDETNPRRHIALALQVDSTNDQILLPGDLVLASGEPPQNLDLNDSFATFQMHAMRLRYHQNASTSADIVFGFLTITTIAYKELLVSDSTLNYSLLASTEFELAIFSANATVESEILASSPAVLVQGVRSQIGPMGSASLQDHLAVFLTSLLSLERITGNVFTSTTREITTVNTLSLVLLAFLTAAGVVLGGVRELLLALVAGKSEDICRALTAGEYNTLSKMYCCNRERSADLPLSGLHLQLCSTKHGCGIYSTLSFPRTVPEELTEISGETYKG